MKSIPSIFIDNGQPVSEVFKISKSPSVSSNTNDQNGFFITLEITRILTNEIIRKTDFTNNLQNCLHRMKKKKRNLPSTALSSKEATYCPKCLKNSLDSNLSDKNDNDFPVLIKYQTPVKTVTAENLDPKETIETVNGSTTNPVIAQKEEQYETYRNEDFDTILNGTMNPEEIGQETETEMEKRLYRNAVQICKIDNAEQLKTFNHFYTMRKDLFYRFNDGIQMDFESWFSVTPENVARHIAERLACNIIVDGFCGAGGNSIQFARTCDIVFAIDNNIERLKMAKHNAKVYGYNNIEFILGDFFEVVQNLFFDCFFASPPWGGPNYNKDITHNFNDFNGISGFDLVL